MAGQFLYRLEGDRVIQEFVRQQYSMSRADFERHLKEVSSDSIVATPTLPKGCRFFLQRGNQETYVVEVSPGYHTLTYYIGSRYENDGNHTAEVSMPWQYFIATFEKLQSPASGITHSFQGMSLFWSKDRMKTINDSVLFSAKIPNIDESGHICLGTTPPDSTLSPDARVEALVADFYSPSSVFNEEMGWDIPYGEMGEWEEHSKLDMLWWRPYSHFGPPQTLAELGWGAYSSHPTTRDLLAEAMQNGEALW